MKRSTMTQAVSMITLVLVLGSGTLARSSPGHSKNSSARTVHVLLTPADLTWTDGPPSLPAGSQAAVLEGDPKRAGLFTMRLKVPADYKISSHWHPADEHVTVISGTLYMGMGDTFDESKGTALSAGSFAVMPARTHHFAFTKEETVIQLHGKGPWGITYVNRADDPRKK